MIKKTISWLSIFALAILLSNCDDDRGFVIMPLSQEITMGESLDSIINANPGDYPILDETQYPEAYTFMNNMMNSIRNNQEEPLKYADKFDWKITIIDSDVLNAFAAPGGKLYFYTGLMKYLDNAAELAGVLAHEMAHADLRHSARQLQQQYGLSLVSSIIFGQESSELEQMVISIGSGLFSLKFSRDDEYQADEFSVRYLAGTSYYPKGVTGFFEKMSEEGETTHGWEVLSTHPDHANRIENVNKIWESLGSPDGDLFETTYQEFLTNLP